MPARSVRGRWIHIGRSRLNANSPANIAPMSIWPRAPMLNRPARNASATPSPAAISGAANPSELVSGRICAAKSLPFGLNTAPRKSAS